MDSRDNIFIKINKGTYSLKQAAILAFQQLAEILEKAGYIQTIRSSGMWKHKTRQTAFFLCVVDFGLKYFSRDDADRLLNTFCEDYKYTVDWTGCNICGLTFEWNYTDIFVDVVMPGYTKDFPRKLNHVPDKKLQYSRHEYI